MSGKIVKYPEFIGIKVSEEIKQWLKEDYSNRIRSILEWIQASYPNITEFLELIK